MSDPEFFKRIHSYDQASSAFGTMAGLLGAYFASLQGSGFSRKEAFNLTKIYQKILLKHTFQQSDDSINQKKDPDKNEENGEDDGYFRN